MIDYYIFLKLTAEESSTPLGEEMNASYVHVFQIFGKVRMVNFEKPVKDFAHLDCSFKVVSIYSLELVIFYQGQHYEERVHF